MLLRYILLSLWRDRVLHSAAVLAGNKLQSSMIVSQKPAGERVPPMGQGGGGVPDVKCHPFSPVVTAAMDIEINFSNDCPNSPPVFHSVASQIFPFHTAVRCSEIVNEVVLEPTLTAFVPFIRSGSFADIGSRDSMEDEHICIDDLSTQLGRGFNFPSAFYAVFDGHGGSAAASYIKRNAIRFFFEDTELPQSSVYDAKILEELADSHRRAFSNADIELATESSVSSTCGTTALTALVIGNHLMIANAGDCRAVLCRKGAAFDMSHDHRPSYMPERQRVEEAGGFIDNENYLNGELSVTRALGDWFLKPSFGSLSPLISEPEVLQVTLTEEDEFLIIGCDGIWDVMPSQTAVSLVRRGLRCHDNPELCAKELVTEASRLDSSDNLTAVVICFSATKPYESCPPQRRRQRFSALSADTRSRLQSLLDGDVGVQFSREFS